jgi:hypothetical protein
LVLGVTLAALVGTLYAGLSAGPGMAAPRIDDNDIGGVVTGENGSEAGAWVIAEATDLPTRYLRIVVTDQRGRYVLPDLPAATYDVWVSRRNTVESRRVQTRPGKHVNLTVIPASQLDSDDGPKR